MWLENIDALEEWPNVEHAENVYALQYYPDSVVGFHLVIRGSATECLLAALEHMDALRSG